MQNQDILLNLFHAQTGSKSESGIINEFTVFFRRPRISATIPIQLIIKAVLLGKV
ncbi:hypothetical protein NEISICOT_00623 [Neisseria sicca ATCC 29256]|uniref:Uncharacterized protein n=2 Tax=Neisseria sicca TaxID=490 RepID=I2NHD7_NEISI|nr:hypothetical protein NEISICOT_00623 [Neisseria sicca ATCC 29256]EIG25248.1 hypothetical protein HMPREF1051_0592 [Neisseria sicca VK64]